MMLQKVNIATVSIAPGHHALASWPPNNQIARQKPRHTMTTFYEKIKPSNKGAWVVHHGHKTASTLKGSAEFPAIDAAAKAASLLSQLAATEETNVENSRVEALGRAAGLNPKIELPGLLDVLQKRRLIDRSASGDVAVLGVTSRATAQHASEIFDEQAPTAEERASIAIAELTSHAPMPIDHTRELVSDEFKLTSARAAEMLQRSEMIGFVDAEGRGTDKLLFNGNLFRRHNVEKARKVLDSLTSGDAVKVAELDAKLSACGCVSVVDAEKILGVPLFEKLHAASMYDVNGVSNPDGEHGFVTKPAAFHQFNDPLVDDAFDLAKALVAALTYGMTKSAYARGRITMISRLLGSLINGNEVGPATAIGEDYQALETRGVIRVFKASPYGFKMRLLKKDIGEMALKVLTTGEAASSNAIERPLPGAMTGYASPEKTRSDFRRKQDSSSKRMTQDVLEVLRTRGKF